MSDAVLGLEVRVGDAARLVGVVLDVHCHAESEQQQARCADELVGPASTLRPKHGSSQHHPEHHYERSGEGLSAVGVGLIAAEGLAEEDWRGRRSDHLHACERDEDGQKRSHEDARCCDGPAKHDSVSSPPSSSLAVLRPGMRVLRMIAQMGRDVQPYSSQVEPGGARGSP